MSLDNNNENYEQQRRRKAENFHLNIQDDYDPAEREEYDSSAELNSYSGQDVKDEIARKSKSALKRRKKEEKRELKEKNKRNRRVFRLTWLVSVLLVGAMFSVYIVTGMNDLLAINRGESKEVTVEIPKDPNLDIVSEKLKESGVITEPSYFKLFASMTKSTDDFRQGTFKMRTDMDYEAIINALVSNSNRTDTVKVMITEGQNVLEVANTLKKNGVLADVDKFLELCASDEFDDDFSFLKQIKNAKDRYFKLEGYLYPDTYEFYKNDEPKNIIYRFLNVYEAKLSEKQEARGYEKLRSINQLMKDTKTSYSIDEIMTIASIIQAEAANVDDMYIVSSVLHNRLEYGEDYGVANLGLDSTAFYPFRSADGEKEKDVPDIVKNKNLEGKYDTYKNEGLPAGSICNPGMDAIRAALLPSDTSYYYFCHSSDGQAYYATTLYEHNANLELIK